MYKDVIDFIKSLYPNENPVPLHVPCFTGNEKKYLNDCIDSTFVSYLGAYVKKFEEMMAQYVGVKHAIATVNGTAALHLALMGAGVKRNDEVITQALTFVATVNAICYVGAAPIFIDSDKLRLGLSFAKLEEFLVSETERRADGYTYNKKTGRRISACVPMHVFGFPLEIAEVSAICKKYNIALLEDAAESLGSFVVDRHTGTFGKAGILSFNGNKTITTGGGGMVITDDDELAQRIRHISTTAKVAHSWEYIHDEIGYNYRMPNINAAVGSAQMEKLDLYLANKRDLAQKYAGYFAAGSIQFLEEKAGTRANYWLNTILLKNRAERDVFLRQTNEQKVQTRPIWRLMSKLPMFAGFQKANLDNAEWLEDRVVNIPSSVRFST